MKLSSLSILLGVALFFAACSEDNSLVRPSSGEDVSVGFSFKTAAMEQSGSSTRSGRGVLNLGGGNASGINFSASATRSVDQSGMDESAIKDLWVFQYVSGGNFVRKQYFSTVDVADFRMDLSKNVAGEKSNLYFVANMGPNAFPSVLATETEFKSYGIAITNEASVLPTAGFLPMYGSLTDLTLPDDFINNSNVVTLIRMVSRVDFSFQLAATGLPSGFKIKSVRLMNVPNKSFPYKDAAVTTFPALTDITLLEFDSEAITAIDQTTSAVSLSFYLPENMRGEGTGTVETDKTGITGSTCIQLTGYGDGNEVTYNIYPGGDATKDYNLVRNTTYAVSASITGVDGSLDARVKKSSTSNTYLVRPGSSVNIAVKRANQTTILGNQLSDITTGWSSAVLWRDNSALTVTTDDALQSEGFFTVKVPELTAEGNAVVYITDGTNTLWSWHIWVTNYDPATENQTYGGYTFMDRNLGALNDTPGDVGALGLLYQWGRKDPFAGASTTSLTAEPVATDYVTLYSDGTGANVYNTNSEGSTDPANTMVAPTDIANNLENAIRNPGVFYYGSASPYDWYIGSSTDQNNALWGTTKTVYDPCPSGWKIAPGAAFNTFSTDTFVRNGTIDDDWNALPGRFLEIQPSGSWFPASGSRSSSTGVLSNVGTRGSCWSSAINGTNSSYLSFSSTNVTPANSNFRANGFAVRCVQED